MKLTPHTQCKLGAFLALLEDDTTYSYDRNELQYYVRGYTLKHWANNIENEDEDGMRMLFEVFNSVYNRHFRKKDVVG